MATKEEIIYQQKLVEAAKLRPEAFKVIYDHFYEQIYYFIASRVDNENDVDDVCSQSFMKAMIKIKQYKFKGLPFSAWLYRITMNEINLFYRQSKKNRSIIIDELSLPEIIEETQYNYSQESIDKLIQSIHFLKPEEVEILELRYFEKRSVNEVAAILNLTPANVKVKCHRVIKKLKNYMQGNE